MLMQQVLHCALALHEVAIPLQAYQCGSGTFILRIQFQNPCIGFDSRTGLSFLQRYRAHTQ